MMLGFMVVMLLSLVRFSQAAPPAHSPPGRTVYLFICGTWEPEEPKAAWGLFDVFFGIHGGPTEAQLHAIQNAGGRIVYEFNLPVVRARLPVSAVPLVEAEYVQSVSRPNVHADDVIIGIPLPLSDLDRQFLDDIGAIVLNEFDFIDAIHAIVPDESIPALALLPGVSYIELNGFRCPA